MGPWTLPFGMIFFVEQNPRFKETHEPPMLGCGRSFGRGSLRHSKAFIKHVGRVIRCHVLIDFFYFKGRVAGQIMPALEQGTLRDGNFRRAQG